MGEFIAGVLISIPVAIFSPFVTVRIQKWRSTHNENQARVRREILKRQLAEVEDYHEDQVKLLLYIVVQIFYLLVLWIGQSALDFVIGFFANASFFAGSISVGSGFLVPPSEFESAVSVVRYLVDVMILALILRTGMRGYRLVTKVVNFDKYVEGVRQELSCLDSEFPKHKISKEVPMEEVVTT
jgi:hypothetical protein